MWRIRLLLVCVALTACTAPVHPGESVPGLVSTWGASAVQTDTRLDDITVRNIVTTSVAGTGIRVRLTNVIGVRALPVDAVYLGVVDPRAPADADLLAGTNRPVTFAGRSAVTLPPGQDLLSDPVPGTVAARSTLAISVHTRGSSLGIGHQLALRTSYLSTRGDHAAEESGRSFPTATSSWFWVDALAVTPPDGASSVVALGDSITDGVGSPGDADQRWPDYLADRILAAGRDLGVVDAGISGNQVLHGDDGNPSALSRLDHDVLDRPGVRTVVLLEGINDILAGGSTAEEVIAGYREVIDRTHDRGICILGGTLTPYDGASASEESRRTAVNAFIRGGGQFDGVLDFDAAIADPDDPARIAGPFDSGDGLHPSAAGYAAMADVVDLSRLSCAR